ncbi:MAG: MBL fold metallo-hydrolase [Oceanicoccus sp.]
MIKRLALLCSLPLLLLGCHASSISTAPANVGQPISIDELIAVIGQPGPIEFEKHLAATWSINLSGLLNLEHPKAIAAGIEDREEPIELYVYSLEHPEKGIFFVDSGVSERFSSPADNPDLSFIVNKAMGLGKLKTVLTTAELARAKSAAIDGVFLTHIHTDHIMGLRDLPLGTPVYTGPGEASLSSVQHMATQGSTDRLLGNSHQLLEWQFDESGLIDIFGDKSVIAIHSPGHTPGSTAYLIRSTKGVHLLVGDATHTRWGWENGVEAGSFSADLQQSAESLQRLLKLSQDNPGMTVHPGHQSL